MKSVLIPICVSLLLNLQLTFISITRLALFLAAHPEPDIPEEAAEGLRIQ